LKRSYRGSNQEIGKKTFRLPEFEILDRLPKA
jgi:hypothetical protein